MQIGKVVSFNSRSSGEDCRRYYKPASSWDVCCYT